MRIIDWSSDVCSSDLRDEVALHGALDQAVLDLQRDQRRPATKFRDRLHARDLPGRRVGDADIKDLARADEMIEAAKNLFDRGREVPCVKVEQRSEERRVGKEWVSTCRSRGVADH